MVTIDRGHVMIVGDSMCLALEIIAFLGSINEMKKQDYENYKAVEEALLMACEEEQEFLDTIKEFALNMTEVFS